MVQILLKLLPSLLHNQSAILSEPDLRGEAGGYGEHRFLELPVELHEVVIAPRHCHADGLIPRLLQRVCRLWAVRCECVECEIRKGKGEKRNGKGRNRRDRSDCEL